MTSRTLRGESFIARAIAARKELRAWARDAERCAIVCRLARTELDPEADAAAAAAEEEEEKEATRGQPPACLPPPRAPAPPPRAPAPPPKAPASLPKQTATQRKSAAPAPGDVVAASLLANGGEVATRLADAPVDDDAEADDSDGGDEDQPVVPPGIGLESYNNRGQVANVLKILEGVTRVAGDGETLSWVHAEHKKLFKLPGKLSKPDCTVEARTPAQH